MWLRQMQESHWCSGMYAEGAGWHVLLGLGGSSSPLWAKDYPMGEYFRDETTKVKAKDGFLGHLLSFPLLVSRL